MGPVFYNGTKSISHFHWGQYISMESVCWPVTYNRPQERRRETKVCFLQIYTCFIFRMSPLGWEIVRKWEKKHGEEWSYYMTKVLSHLIIITNDSSGLCRSIGVSNFDETNIEVLFLRSLSRQVNPRKCLNMLLFFLTLINVNAILSTIRRNCRNSAQTIVYCSQSVTRILLWSLSAFQGHCPLAKGKVCKDEIVAGIGLRHNKTPAQVLFFDSSRSKNDTLWIALRWAVENGVPVIPKSKSITRVEENTKVSYVEGG